LTLTAGSRASSSCCHFITARQRLLLIRCKDLDILILSRAPTSTTFLVTTVSQEQVAYLAPSLRHHPLCSPPPLSQLPPTQVRRAFPPPTRVLSGDLLFLLDESLILVNPFNPRYFTDPWSALVLALVYFSRSHPSNLIIF